MSSNAMNPAKRLQIGLVALESLGVDLLASPKVTKDQLQDYRTMSDTLLTGSGIAGRRRISLEDANDNDDIEDDEELEDLLGEEEDGDEEEEIDLDVPDEAFLEEEEQEDEDEGGDTSSTDEQQQETDSADAEGVETRTETEGTATTDDDSTLNATTADEIPNPDESQTDADLPEGTDMSVQNPVDAEEGSEDDPDDLEVPEPEAPENDTTPEATETDPASQDDSTSLDTGDAAAVGGDDPLADDVAGLSDDGSTETDLTGQGAISSDDSGATPAETAEIADELQAEQQEDEAEAEARREAADQAEAEEEAEVRRELEAEIQHVRGVAGKVGTFITRTEDSGLSTNDIKEMAELQQSSESLKALCVLDHHLAKSPKANVRGVRRILRDLHR